MDSSQARLLLKTFGHSVPQKLGQNMGFPFEHKQASTTVRFPQGAAAYTLLFACGKTVVDDVVVSCCTVGRRRWSVLCISMYYSLTSRSLHLALSRRPSFSLYRLPVDCREFCCCCCCCGCRSTIFLASPSGTFTFEVKPVHTDLLLYAFLVPPRPYSSDCWLLTAGAAGERRMKPPCPSASHTPAEKVSSWTIVFRLPSTVVVVPFWPAACFLE